MIGTPFSAEDDLPLRAARGDAQLMNAQIRTAFLDFLAAECRSNPVLILLEDLHWGDTPTVALIGRALGDLTESPLLVLALARPEVHQVFQKLWDGRSMQEIRMQALSKKAAERLVTHTLGARVPAETVQKIVELSEGNAFYLEELIRATAEGHGDNLPETVVAMVQSRLGALSDAERRILRAASIFGETFWTGGISTLLGDADAHAGKVDERVRALVEKELFFRRAESRFPNETEVAFRHALLREGAYSLLTDEDRSLGHRLVGEWLEQHGEDAPVVLAEHFEKGGDGAKAGAYWARASERALQGVDTERGILYAHRGLACPISLDVRNHLLGSLCISHYFQMETLASARPHAEELLRASDPGSTGWAQALTVMLVLGAQGGNKDEFAAVLNNILTTELRAEAADATCLLIGVAVYLLDFSANIPQANAMYTKLKSLSDVSGERFPAARAMCVGVAGVRYAYAKQDPWQGAQCSWEAHRLYQALGHRLIATGFHVFVALNSWYMGAKALAKSIFTDAKVSDEELGLASSLCPFGLAWLLAESGAYTEARECATELVVRSQAFRPAQRSTRPLGARRSAP